MFASYGVEQAHLPAFFIGLLSGFLFSGVIMSVVDSAINTVIVCKCHTVLHVYSRFYYFRFWNAGYTLTCFLLLLGYAEDPAAFQQNHPHLATAMRSAWTEAWPGISM
jgi:hypothetical protein